MAAETGISKTSVQRYFQLFGLQPHRTQSFKLSNDPFFVEKLRDVVGLYLSPPDNALVICVDEKSQCQALERAQPMLPMGLGYVEGVSHDYIFIRNSMHTPVPREAILDSLDDLAAGDKFTLIHLLRGQIVDASCVNKARDFTALKRLITSGARPDRSALAGPATDLRKLAA